MAKGRILQDLETLISPADWDRLRGRGEALRDRIVQAIIDHTESKPRTQQSQARVLGMSDLGACREYVRATIAGEPRGPEKKINWAAEVGTAVGDYVEGILANHGFDTQETVTLHMTEEYGFQVNFHIQGHLDEVDVGTGDVADNKTVDGFADLDYDGPPDKNVIQISGYLVALVQAGRLDRDAYGHLVYFDRSGKNATPRVWTIDFDTAMRVLLIAQERMLDVAHALKTSSRNGRDGKLMTDEPESYCHAIQCPFYESCWAGYSPTDEITHQRELDSVAKILQARADKKDAIEREENAKAELQGVEGVTPDKTVVRWTLTAKPTGGFTERLDVRKPK